MARRSPLVTLLAGGVLGVGLLVASMAATPESGDEPAANVTQSPAADAADDGPTPQQTDSPAATDEPEPIDAPSQDADEPDSDESEQPTQPPAEAPEAVTYVGYVDSGEATVAVIVTGDEAIAYVCDGVSREAWLSGPAVDGRLELTGDRGSMSASADGSVAEGETTVDGQTWTFSFGRVDPPDGLYRFAGTIAGGADVVGGWIVLPDGEQIGLVNVDGDTQPAESLDIATGQVTIDGDVVTAERQG